jgi:hypothetical protein
MFVKNDKNVALALKGLSIVLHVEAFLIKTQFAIDTVNIYCNRQVTKLYLKFMILKFKWRHREIWRHSSPN